MEQTTETRTQRAVDALRKAVLARTVTMKDVAAKVARSHHTVSHWVSGAHSPPLAALPILEELIGLS